jgi:hypothetical protein
MSDLSSREQRTLSHSSISAHSAATFFSAG